MVRGLTKNETDFGMWLFVPEARDCILRLQELRSSLERGVSFEIRLERGVLTKYTPVTVWGMK